MAAHAIATAASSHIIAFPSSLSSEQSSKQIFVSPAEMLPSKAAASTSDQDIEANKKKIEESGPLARALKTVVEWLDYFSDNGVQLSGYPLFWLGSALLIFGTGATLHILLTTLSVEAVLTGYGLATLMLGGLLRELGHAMRNGAELGTALGNILYIPLRYLLRLSV